MRTTLYRQRTPRDDGRIQLIYNALAAVPHGTYLGEAQLCRAGGLPWGRSRPLQRRSVHKLRDLMTDVSRLVAVSQPGYTLYRPGDGTACITDNEMFATKMALTRAFKVFTAMRRVVAEAEPWRVHPDPLWRSAYGALSGALAFLETAVGPSVVQAADAYNKS